MSATIRADLDGGPFPLKKSSLFQHFGTGLRLNPDGAAAIVMHQSSSHLAQLIKVDDDQLQQTAAPNNSFLTWTYRQLHRAAFRLANALLAAGINPGQSTTVSLLPNGIEYSLLLWTCALLKVTISSLDPGALQAARQAELEGYLTAIKPNAVFVPDYESAEIVDRVVQDGIVSKPEARITIAQPGSKTSPPLQGWSSLVDFVQRAAKNQTKSEASMMEEAQRDDPDRVAVIIFTSGTSSGKPKGCPRTVRNVIHGIEAYPWIDGGGMNGRSILHTANFRAVAWSLATQPWTVGGASVMPSAVFDSEKMLEAIEVCKGRFLFLVPFQLHALVDHPTFSVTRVASVDTIATGADVVTEDLLAKIESGFPDASIIAVLWGMTEGAGYAQGDLGRGTDRKAYSRGIASVGKVMKGAKIRIVNTTTNEVEAREVPGEIHVNCASVIRGYLGGVKAEDFYHDDQGDWFKTGDLGHISKDGDVFIHGRIKDVIKRAGVGISPAALENCVSQQTGIQCAVIGVPHPTLGQEAFAILQNLNGTNKEKLKKCVLDEFGPDSALAGAASLDELGLQEFPTNATGKIMKIELEEPVKRFLKC